VVLKRFDSQDPQCPQQYLKALTLLLTVNYISGLQMLNIQVRLFLTNEVFQSFVISSERIKGILLFF